MPANSVCVLLACDYGATWETSAPFVVKTKSALENPIVEFCTGNSFDGMRSKNRFPWRAAHLEPMRRRRAVRARPWNSLKVRY